MHFMSHYILFQPGSVQISKLLNISHVVQMCLQAHQRRRRQRKRETRNVLCSNLSVNGRLVKQLQRFQKTSQAIQGSTLYQRSASLTCPWTPRRWEVRTLKWWSGCRHITDISFHVSDHNPNRMFFFSALFLSPNKHRYFGRTHARRLKKWTAEVVDTASHCFSPLSH